MIAIPIEPPRFLIMLYSEDAAAAVLGSRDPVAIVDSGTNTRGKPKARINCDQTNCSPEKSSDILDVLKQLKAKMERPIIIIRRLSITLINFGINGVMNNWGKPNHISTCPICCAL